MKPSIALKEKRRLVRDAASRFRTASPRVFGSVLHGHDTDGSDLDLVVDPLPDTTLFDLGGLQLELEELLACRSIFEPRAISHLSSAKRFWRRQFLCDPEPAVRLP